MKTTAQTAKKQVPLQNGGTHIRETPFPYRETPFSHGETPLVLKKAFVALYFLIDGGIPRCGSGKNVATAAN